MKIFIIILILIIVFVGIYISKQKKDREKLSDDPNYVEPIVEDENEEETQ